MLKTILSVSGRPGLYKKISQGTNLMVVESLVDQKRFPAYTRDKVISLGDIAIYTTETEVPLYEVFNGIKAKENGEKITLDLPKLTADELRAYLVEVLPDFDRERVYPTDIKRLLSWYNILLNAGITDFAPLKEEEKAEVKEEVAEPQEESKPAAKITKTTATQKVSVPKKATATTKQSVGKTTQRTRQK